MALPKFNEMYVPTLKILSERGEDISTQSMRLFLKEHYRISDEDYAETSSKGNNIFYGRLSWCLSDLFRSGLVIKPKQGIYRISALGKEKLSSPDSVEQYILETVRNLDAQRIAKNNSKPKSTHKNTEEEKNSPSETMEQAYQEIKEVRKQEILELILQKKPGQFERLTLDLLKTMGYGGTIQDAHKQTPLSNDGGIDGIIKEDILGLGYIYIQAKRYALDRKVDRPEVQQFIGAISSAQSNKGVFITTSDFTQGAYECVKDKSIVLINGDRLSEYIYEYGLGMQSEAIYEIKKIDQDFWGDYLDEEK